MKTRVGTEEYAQVYLDNITSKLNQIKKITKEIADWNAGFENQVWEIKEELNNLNLILAQLF